jgi:hypothetical protein
MPNLPQPDQTSLTSPIQVVPSLPRLAKTNQAVL